MNVIEEEMAIIDSYAHSVRHLYLFHSFRGDVSHI
jgi:hypothetical protein